MLPFLRESFGNPNSAYSLGQKARRAVEQARGEVAALVGAADPAEIVFTSGGSEADVLAIAGGAWGAFDQSKGVRRRLVSSRVEHDAVRGILGQLNKRGFSTALAGVDASCRVCVAEAAALITPETALVSIMHANNEVGTVQPVAELAAAAREKGALFHTDAVQSAGKLEIDVQKLGVDLLALSGHKLNAPKGVGALFVRKGVRLAPVITGHQEKNRRGGTENVAGIVGLGTACALARKELSAHAVQLEALRQKLTVEVLKIPGSRLNGADSGRLASCAHFSFEGIDGHSLVVALDLEAICVSSGPACSTGIAEPSHVLTAMGLDASIAAGSIRVSLGWSSSGADIDRLLAALPGAVERLRRVPAKAGGKA